MRVRRNAPVATRWEMNETTLAHPLSWRYSIREVILSARWLKVSPIRDSVFEQSKGLRMRFVSIFLLCTAMMQAQQIPSVNAPPSMRVHGEATVSVEPDQLQFDIGVVTQASTAKEATDQNDTQSKALIRELRSAFPSASVKSINFSVNPNYHYPPEGPPTIAGYTSSNTVRLLLNDVSKLRDVIDIAVKSGAKSINRLTFSLKNENPVRAEAFAKAAEQAQAGAQALAAALKLKLGRLLSVEEGQPVLVSPPRQISFENLGSTNVAPVTLGTIDVHADVNLTYEIVQAAERPRENNSSATHAPAPK